MQSISLLFKVLWSPGEAMFTLSKSPKVLAPIVFLCLFSTLTGAVIMTKVDTGELAMRAIEKSPQGKNLSDETKEAMRQRVSSPAAKAFGLAATVIGPIVVITLVGALYFAVFTMLGREGSFKTFFSITAFAAERMVRVER